MKGRILDGVDGFPEIPFMATENVCVERCSFSRILEFEDWFVVGRICSGTNSSDEIYQFRWFSVILGMFAGDDITCSILVCKYLL